MKKFILFFILSLIYCRENILYYIPPYDNNINSGKQVSDNKFIDLNEPSGQYTGFRAAFVYLKNKLKKINNFLKLVSPQKKFINAIAVLDHDAHHPTNNKCPGFREYLNFIPYNKKILIMGEPPIVLADNYYGQDINSNTLPNLFKQYSKVLSIVDDPYMIALKTNNHNVKKIYFPQPILQMIEPVPFNKKKLCTLIGGDKLLMFPEHARNNPNNGYFQRKNWVNFCITHSIDMDVWGGYTWTTWDENCKIYKGLPPLVNNSLLVTGVTRGIIDKIHLVKNYKFYICYENEINCRGWITEKIFESFISGCVPIYWGAQNIYWYVPKNCFIDRRDFSCDKDLYDFISQMSEFEYNNYLNNIKNYLKSDDISLFSIQYFAYQILSTVIDNIDINIFFNAIDKSIIEKAIKCQIMIDKKLINE